MPYSFDPNLLRGYDSVFVSPHWDDAALACAGRLAAACLRGEAVLVLTLFGGSADEAAPESARTRGLQQLGVAQLSTGLPEARRRRPDYASFAALTGEVASADEDVQGQIAHLLTELALRGQARQVFLPLGVGGHVDHRLVHEAGRSAFQHRHGWNVFFYEERPEALVRGAVRARLAELGARLPPGAAEAAERGRLAGYLWRFHLGPAFRGDLRGPVEALGALPLAARNWRASRAWRPLRAFGARFQPVIHAAPAEGLDAVRTLAGALPPRLERLGAAYHRRLGGDGSHLERYWLLLPERDAEVDGPALSSASVAVPAP